MYPNLPRLELGDVEGVLRDVEAALPTHCGKAFEEVARQTLLALNGRSYEGQRFEFQELGGWWDKDEELDAVAVGKRQAWAVEAKFRNEAADVGVVDQLLRRAELFRKACRRPLQPLLLSRSGFPPRARERMEAGEFLGWSIEDVERIHAGEATSREGSVQAEDSSRGFVGHGHLGEGNWPERKDWRA